MIKKISFITGTFFLLSISFNALSSEVASKDPAESIILILNKLERFSNNADSTNTDKSHTFIKNNIISHFALNEMAQWISGPYSKNMSLKEKNGFKKQLEKAFIKIISNNIGSFKTIKTRVKIQPTQYKSDNEAIIKTRVTLYNNSPIKLDFHMRLIKSQWKIIDIKTLKTSALIYYRHYFMPQLRMYAQK